MRGRQKKDELFSDDDSDGSQYYHEEEPPKVVPLKTPAANKNDSQKEVGRKGILKSVAKENKKSVKMSSTDKEEDNFRSKTDLDENEIEILKLDNNSSSKKKFNHNDEVYYAMLNDEEYKLESDPVSGDEVDEDDRAKSSKSSVFEKIDVNASQRVLTGKFRQMPSEKSEEDSNGIRNGNETSKQPSSRFKRRSTAHKRRTALQQLKEEFLSTREGIELFKKFLAQTGNGKDLLEFWIELEEFKDEFEQFEEYGENEIGNKQFRKILRDIMSKYNISTETKEQIRKTLRTDGFSMTMFMRTQYDILRRLRSYWVPRYLEHMEKTEGIRVPSAFRALSLDTKSKPSSVTGVTTATEGQSYNLPTEPDDDFNDLDFDQRDEEDDALPDKQQDFAMHHHVDVSKSLPLKPDITVIRMLENPMKTWSDVEKIDKKPDSRVKSGVKRSPEEWKEHLQPEEDYFVKALEADKQSGSPFLRHLQKCCLNASTESSEKKEMKNVAKLLFWQDSNMFSESLHLYTNEHAKQSAAWSIFNKFFNPLSIWFIEMKHKEIEKMRLSLQDHSTKFDKELFKPAADKIVKELRNPWVTYNRDDLRTFITSRDYVGYGVLSRFREFSGISLDKEDELNLRRYPGSTESQIRTRVHKELLEREREAELIEMEKQKVREEAINKIHAARRKIWLAQKRKYRKMMDDDMGDPIPQRSILRTREGVENKDENQWKAKPTKKQKSKSAWVQSLTLENIMEDKSLYRKFVEYLKENEREGSMNKIMLFVDLNNHFKLSRDQKEQSSMNITSTYLRRDSARRVEIPKMLAFRELRPNDAKLQAIQEYVQKEVDEFVDYFKQGYQFITKVEASKKYKGEKVNPPIWAQRKAENGLVENDDVAVKVNPTLDDRELLKSG